MQETITFSKKIVFINVAYYPAVGGTQRVTQMIAEGCVANGWEVYVLCLYPQDRTLFEFNGVKIRKVTGIKDIFSNLNIIKPNIVYCNMIHNILTIKFALYSLFSSKSYISMVNSVGGYGKGNTLQTIWMSLTKPSKRYIISDSIRVLLLMLMNKVFDYYIVMDDKGLDYKFDSKYISKEKIRFISQGLNFEELDKVANISFQDIRTKYNLTFENYYVCAHNFQVWKNHKDLVDFFIKNSGKNLVILGSTSMSHKESIEILETAKSIKNIKVITDIKREDFLSIIYNSLGHISFSLVEGHQNNVLLECLYLNKLYITSPATQDYSYFPNAVVCKNVTQLRSILDSIQEYTVKLNSSGKTYCIEHKMDWKDIITSYINLFREALNAN